MSQFSPVFWSKQLISAVRGPLPELLQHKEHDFCMYYIAKGSCCIMQNSSVIPLSCGSVILFAPDALHLLVPEADCMFYQLQLSDELVEYLLPLNPDFSQLLIFFLQAIFQSSDTPYINITPGGVAHEAVRLQLEQICDSMCVESQRIDSYSNHILFHLLQLLLHIALRDAGTLQSPADTASHERNLCIIGQYLLQNYATGTLSSLAQQLNFTVSYCSHYVKTVTGASFKQLQKKIRMQKAVNCLLHTDMQINQISELIGYSSPENFMKTFSSEYGMSPSTFRQSAP